MSDPSSKPKVVVTGIGVVHALGNTTDDFWNGIVAGRSGIRKLQAFDTTEYTSKIGAEVIDYDPVPYFNVEKDIKRTDRYVHYTMGAGKQAIADAKLDMEQEDPYRVGVLVGSGIGGLETVQEQAWRLKERGPRKVSPFMIPSLIANIASGVLAIDIKAKGPNFAVVSACSTATHALGEAAHMIMRGDADVMIAGGSEAAITQVGYAGFCSMKAMSTNFNDEPERASRPFDALRDGFIMGDGSGVLVLESEEHAKARGARIYCELSGYAATCDAYHITSPDVEGEGLAMALRRALSMAKMEPEQVDYINAHGTSTPYNDKFETLAIKKVFGEYAYKLPVSSTKSMTGHLLGAAGGIEAAIIAKVIETGIIPPTINYENPDPDCDLDYVPNQAREGQKVDVAMSNNLGFGGHNATIIFNRLG
ncbi:beta-ketoacyl-ACP synthase II [Cerasicoccus fimbriatus]|uniref:beta-ketoacyl-ACP synthase II n=1 Tax=Cerasicoccus fimbriatus TaxID=3014554 RepID=UPI0022B35B35|nr:beta-ketoacyl-ACP synthase II [Cerasicoccus sp. TK19100]